MINRVVLVGRLTRDPELRKTQSGTSVCSFTMAVGCRVSTQGQPDADFINCVAWNKTADLMTQYLHKGSLIGLEGRIQTRSYDDKDGNKRYITEVIADNVEFLGSKSSNNNSSSDNQGPTPYDFDKAPDTKGTDVDNNPFADFGSSIEISDDELPF